MLIGNQLRRLQLHKVANHLFEISSAIGETKFTTEIIISYWLKYLFFSSGGKFCLLCCNSLELVIEALLECIPYLNHHHDHQHR